MAKKKTYAAVMKELSNKKASYEQGLEEANRTGNRSGVADYKRRLTKLSAGMDELFQAQEVSKAPTQGNFATGGMTKKQAMYATGGSYSSNMDPMKFEGGGDTRPMSFTLAEYEKYKDFAELDAQKWGAGYEDYMNYGTLIEAARQAGWDPSQGDFDMEAWTDVDPGGNYGSVPKMVAQLRRGNKLDEMLSHGEKPMAGTKFPKDNRMAGYYGSGISLLPYDGRPGAMVEDGMMAVMQTKAGPIVLKPTTWKTYQTKPESFNKFIETIGDDPQSYRQYAFNPETYDQGTFSKGGTGTFIPNNEDAQFYAQQQSNVAAEASGGSAKTAVKVELPEAAASASSPVSTGGIPDQTWMEQMNAAVNGFSGAPTAGTPAAAGAPATGLATTAEQLAGLLGFTPETAPANVGASAVGPTTTATATTPTAPARREFQQVTPLGGLDPSRILNTAKGDAYFGADGAGRSIIQDPLGPGTVGDPSIPTKSHGMGDLRNRIGDTASGLLGKIGGAGSGAGIPKGVGMALGAAAQFIPDLKTMKSMRDLEGPVDTPQMRAFVQDTNIDNTAALAAIKNQEARAMASAAQNISNPQVAAAAMRANQRIAAEQEARILSGEAQSELAMRNQNLGMLADVGNKNRMINAQNLQRQADFSNERLAAENRMRQQMGVKLGGAVSDFQNRAQDLKKWEMLSKLDLYNVAGRNDIDPTS